MRPRYFVCITLLVLCHLQVSGQTLTNAVPSSSLPDDPDQEMLPVAQPEPEPPTGIPVQAAADNQEWKGNVWTGTGRVEFHYRDYILRADKVLYDRSTAEVHAEGHVQVSGGPNDVLINADHGDMRLNLHTARFFNVTGSQGIRTAGHSVVYSTANPFLFSGRVLIQAGEGQYRNGPDDCKRRNDLQRAERTPCLKAAVRHAKRILPRCRIEFGSPLPVLRRARPAVMLRRW